MDEKQRGYRVQNLMKRINLADVKNLRRWAVCSLLKWQPLARRIRLEEMCGVGRCRSKLSMSYQLKEFDKPGRTNRRGEPMESCGYWCPSCGFSAAGTRPIFKRRNAMTVADDEADAAKAYLEALKSRRVASDRKFIDFHPDDRRK